MKLQKAAIEAEIAHAKQGLAHFESRVESLEKMLLQLVSVDGGVLDAPRKAAKTPARKSQAIDTKQNRKTKGRKSGKSANELPFTGGDYWLNLISDQHQSAAEILQVAISQLEFTPSDEQVKKLTQRMTFALNALVNVGTIQDSGKGRGRRFFKG